jgi:hypothetical protein
MEYQVEESPNTVINQVLEYISVHKGKQNNKL